MRYFRKLPVLALTLALASCGDAPVEPVSARGIPAARSTSSTLSVTISSVPAEYASPGEYVDLRADLTGGSGSYYYEWWAMNDDGWEYKLTEGWDADSYLHTFPDGTSRVIYFVYVFDAPGGSLLADDYHTIYRESSSGSGGGGGGCTDMC